MEKSEITKLITGAVAAGNSIWADLGSGDGAFTLALKELGGPDMEIYSIDRDSQKLGRQKISFAKHYGLDKIHFLKADFTGTIKIPPLDGILMANSLHFVDKKKDFLIRLREKYLKAGGRLLLVEYEMDKGNPFVPYPLSFETFKELATDCGYKDIVLLTTAQSTYGSGMYSAVGYNKDNGTD